MFTLGSSTQSRRMIVAAFMGPSIFMIALVFLVPIGYCIYLSLHKYYILVPERPFIGFQNYLNLFSNPAFWHSLSNTLYFTFVAVTVEILLGLLIALLLNQPFRGRAVLQTALIVPWAIPWVANGIIWKWIFNPKFGALNGLLKQLGLITSYKIWLGKPFTALNMVVLADVWKETSFIAIILLAGLQTIPKVLHEAAAVEGANVWQRFWNVTLPLIRPILFVALTLRTIWAFKTFDLIFALTQGGPMGGTEVLNYHIYQISFTRLKFGYGSSLSVVLTVIVLGLTLMYYRLVFREVEY